jgi:hypothetical protein
MTQTVKKLIERYRPAHPPSRYGSIYYDTSDFMRISYGDVIALQDQYYLVLRDEKERSYGIEDPKYWVKRCQKLETGERRILKLVFHETFPVKIGDLEICCYRSPEKEARILKLVANDPRFMQGIALEDSKKNNVRILEIVRGKRLDQIIDEIEIDHHTYFFEIFPEILKKFISACEAISFLNKHGEKHGDIRRDHLWVEKGTGQYRWIDFDYTFHAHENPFGLDIFGLGTLLLYLTGKGYYTLQNMQERGISKQAIDSLEKDDFCLLFHNRLTNLKKILQYIPQELNLVLMHFSKKAETFYESVDELIADLNICLQRLT